MGKPWTHEEYVSRVHAIGNYTILGTYVNSCTKIKVRCNECGEVKSKHPQTILRRKCKCQLMLTHEEYVEKVHSVYGEKYSIVGTYQGSNNRIDVQCNTCKTLFNVIPSNFVNQGAGSCPECNSSKSKFESKWSSVYGDKYTLISYSGFNKPGVFRCNRCNNVFSVAPACLVHADESCGVCRGYDVARCTTEQFQFKLDNKFEIGEFKCLDEYINAHIKLRILHTKCGTELFTTPHNILNHTKGGCAKCAFNAQSNTLEFGNLVNELTNGEYKLIGDYVGAREKTEVFHNLCGNTYEVTPDNFKHGKRCPVCMESKGERLIRLFLENCSIPFKRQYEFDGCHYILPLPFDFAVFDDNKLFCLIEYDGEQHFRPMEYFGGNAGFEYRKRNDRIKNDYCRDNGIKLIRIPYTEFDHIEEILLDELRDIVQVYGIKEVV